MNKTSVEIKEEICLKTQQGIKHAWRESQEFYGEIDDLLFDKIGNGKRRKFNKLFDSEYLITVNIAQSLKLLNTSYHGSPYRILLEHPTKTFATNCTPLIVKSNEHAYLPSSSIRIGQSNTVRNGKIDIAVYDNCTPAYSLKPICPIEVKGFNPSKNNVIGDLKRNLDFFKLTSNTGNSELPFSIFATIELRVKSPTKERRESNLDRVKRKYEGYISCTNIPNIIHKDVIVFDIDYGQPHSEENPAFETEGYTIANHFHIIGILVVFFNSTICSPFYGAQSVSSG